jgi:hypothetical protein
MIILQSVFLFYLTVNFLVGNMCFFNRRLWMNNFHYSNQAIIRSVVNSPIEDCYMVAIIELLLKCSTLTGGMF